MMVFLSDIGHGVLSESHLRWCAYCQVPGMTFFLSITVDDGFSLYGTGHDILKPDKQT